jgi:hypothetical protein
MELQGRLVCMPHTLQANCRLPRPLSLLRRTGRTARASVAQHGRNASKLVSTTACIPIATLCTRGSTQGGFCCLDHLQNQTQPCHPTWRWHLVHSKRCAAARRPSIPQRHQHCYCDRAAAVGNWMSCRSCALLGMQLLLGCVM